MEATTVPHGFLDIMGRMLLAVVAGAIIGIDRELQRKPAGVRTHALVAMGACMFTMIGLIVADVPTLDLSAPGRVVQGVVAGVGFIGAGAIFRREGLTGGQGLTTAASVWVVAAVGAGSAAGLWRLSAVAVVLAVLILLLEEPVDRLVDYMSRRRSARESGERPSS